MEHEVIGSSIALGIIFLSAIAGGLVLGRYCPSEIPAQKLKLMPLIVIPLWLILTVGQYYLDNFMSDGKTSIRGIVVPDVPVFALFVSIWISAYTKQKSAPIAKEKAAPLE